MITQQDLAAECVVVSGALLHSAGCYQPRGCIRLRVRKGLQLGVPSSRVVFGPLSAHAASSHLNASSAAAETDESHCMNAQRMSRMRPRVTRRGRTVPSASHRKGKVLVRAHRELEILSKVSICGLKFRELPRCTKIGPDFLSARKSGPHQCTQ